MQPTFRISPLTRLVLAIVLALTLFVATLLSISRISRAADPNPQSVTGYGVYTLAISNSITAAGYGPARLVGGYGIMDCYSIVLKGAGTNAVTPTLQNSADACNWVNDQAILGQSADGTVLSRTVIYGLYYRVYLNVANSTAISATIKCITKNNGG
jgi:hypothetical protein